MSFNKKEKQIIEKALTYWQEKQFIDHELSSKLKKELPTKGFDWKNLALYASVFALVSLIIAVISIFADEALLKLIDSFIESSYLTKTIVAFLLSGVFYYLDIRTTKKKTINRAYSKEIFALLAAVSLAIASGLLSFLIGIHESPGILILLLCLIYFTLGKIHLKPIYWYFGLAAILISFGTLSNEFESQEDSFYGMNYPMRFSIFGIILIALSRLLEKYIHPFYHYTYNASVLIFFTALWILSISGNYLSYTDWLEVRQYELWGYSIILFLVSTGAIILGLKEEDSWLKNTGILFTFLNLYTRYFEYFWGSMHKAVFFFIIAFSFWIIGKQAERIWNKKS